MAIGFEIPGPCLIRCDGVVDDTLADLGYTSNDDLPSYEEEVFNRPLTSTRHGDTPVDYVYRGRVATLSLVLIEWDDAELINLLDKFAGATGNIEGELGIAGTRWRKEGAGSPTDHTRQVEILPAITGQFKYTFHHCILNGSGGYRAFDFGNQERAIGLQFVLLPDLNSTFVTDASVFYTKTAV